jgi:hypothetical protein
VVQRYVTFDSTQKEDVRLDHQGMAGYDHRNVDALVDALFHEDDMTPEVLRALGVYLDEGADICFNSFESAASWVLTYDDAPKTVEKPLEKEEK